MFIPNEKITLQQMYSIIHKYTRNNKYYSFIYKYYSNIYTIISFILDPT
ncbi:hypothetical protein PRABACTJOHN_03335 [Parabacteroides johnsonii DSM 18315]|uniref:Uncharacterized protein n=1 Tax=Parabacteroides johnsonii DSM 18315 TaxID=537006 RepID=B7BE58_9BACT|nr:hypothetical protein PRABACTJOHN_03335 [Parabacteroides johnsonii DSM 18315]